MKSPPTTDQLRPPPAWVGVVGLLLASLALLALPLAVAGEEKRGLTIALPLGLIGLVLSASNWSTRCGKAGAVLSVAALVGAAALYLWLLLR